jgi:hypothetical protein
LKIENGKWKVKNDGVNKVNLVNKVQEPFALSGMPGKPKAVVRFKTMNVDLRTFSFIDDGCRRR